MHDLGEPSRLEVSAVLADARGRACPLPIVDLARALKLHALVELWADDPAARGDLVAFCEATGHQLLQVEHGVPLRALVRRGPGPGSAAPRE
jgi:tRNA 2-thiouridine synthesizing protein A